MGSRKKQLIGLSSVLLGGFGLLSVTAAPKLSIDFPRDIQPILGDRCISCHGPHKQKAKFRVDSAPDLFREDYMVIPGNADESELYYRIILPEDDEDMMPAGKEGPLTDEQIGLIRDWINQGAFWPDGLVIPDTTPPPASAEARGPMVIASTEEVLAIEKLSELGILVHPVALNETLTEASFGGVKETDDVALAMSLLAPIRTLERLNLSGVPLKDEQLQAIGGLSYLVHLRLDRTPVTDAVLLHLRGLENLTYLNLFNTGITDAGLDSLKDLPQLERLYVGRTKVTPEGVSRLVADRPGLVVVGTEQPGAVPAVSLVEESSPK